MDHTTKVAASTNAGSPADSGEAKRTVNRKKSNQLKKQRDDVFEMLSEGKHEVEIMANFKLSKAQFKSYLADFLQEVLDGKGTRKPCGYEAFIVASLPKPAQKMLGAKKGDVIKAEQQNGQVVLSIIPFNSVDNIADEIPADSIADGNQPESAAGESLADSIADESPTSAN